MCAAGVAGIMAANVAISAPAIKHTKTMDGKVYHTSADNSDGDNVQQVVVPVISASEDSPVAANGAAENLGAASDG